MSTVYVAVRVDDECNAEQWWDELRERYPVFTASLVRNNAAVIDVCLWAELADLPGFGVGPEYAPNPLTLHDAASQNWRDVTASRHAVFDVLK